MKKRGFTLVEIMIVIAIIALLAAIAIPNLLRARVNANESAAQATLKTIATACESYASANGGAYPTGIADLTGATPPYLNEDYTATNPQGYTYTLTSDASGYTATATATTCGTTGTRNFSITTGAVFGTPAAC